jgi:murein DD-endopeptidase MepM/ murein hydrolase activator NlpD
VTEEVATAPRPHATYRTEAPQPSDTPQPSYTPGAPYTPSAEALAAAAARREQMLHPSAPSYESSRSYETPRAEAPLNTGAIAAQGQGKFIWPVKGDILSPFGVAGMGRRNDGLDIGAPAGSEVRAAAVGEVVYAGDQVPGFGNLVLIKHADGWVTAYAHLDSVNVAMKQEVTQGQSLGSVGMSGGAVQPELHFEVRYAPSPADKAKPVDPVLVLPMG